MYSSQIYCAIKRPFLPGQHIIYCLVGDVYNISSYIMKPSGRLSNILEWCSQRGCDHLDHVEASLRDINQRSFYFLIPDSSGLFVRPPDISALLPTGAGNQQHQPLPPMLKQLDLLPSPFRGWKPFNLVWKWDFFFTYITRVVGYMGVSKKN